MKTFKQIDVAINIILVISFLLIAIANTELFYYAYFIIGGWQVISMTVHSFSGWFMKKGGARRIYIYTTVMILLLVLLEQVIEPFLYTFFALLFESPVMAVIYTSICYAELKALKTTEMLRLR